MSHHEPAEYLGYFLDPQQIGLEWQVRVTAGANAERIPPGLSVATGRTRPEAFRAAMQLVDDFLLQSH